MVQANGRYWEMLWHYRRFALSVFVLAMLGAYGVYHLQPTVYGLQTEIYIEPQPVVGQTATSLSLESLNNQVEILNSDRVRHQAFQNMKSKLGKRLHLSKPDLKQVLAFSQKANSSVVTVSLQAPLAPNDLKIMMQEYIRAYRDTLEDRAIGQAVRESGFWKHQLVQAQKEVHEAYEVFQEFEGKHPSRGPGFSSILDEQRWAVESDIQAAKAELDATRKLLPGSSEEILARSRVNNDLEVMELRKRIVALELAKVEWAAQVPVSDSKIKILNGQLDRASALLTSRLQVLAKASDKPSASLPNGVGGDVLERSLAEQAVKSQLNLDALKAKSNSLNQIQKTLAQSETLSPATELEELALTNRLQMAQEKLHLVQRRLEEASWMQAVSRQFTQVELLNNPDLQVRPVHPHMLLQGLLAVLAGVLLSLAAVGLRMVLDNRLRGSFQLGTLAEKRIFCLDKLPPRKALDTLLERGNFIVPEAYKRVLLYLESLAQTEQVRRIGLMPVGSLPERGMPLITLSLYATEPGYKVAMIDTDFSRQSASALIGSLKSSLADAIQEGAALSDYLSSDSVDFVDIIYPLGKTVYGSLIPSGLPVSNPSAQFSRRGIVHLEEQLSPNYNFVFYGLPPVAESYDAVAVGRILDGVLLVVYPGISPLEQIRQAIQELDAVNARLLGIIVQPV